MIKIGTISPPGWASFCGEEMHVLADEPIDVVDLTMPLDSAFAFATDEIIKAESAIEDAAVTLAAQGVSAMLQIGGPFAFLHGTDGARRIEQRIAAKTGLPFQMMALSMLQALEQCKVQNAIVCSAYYPDAWNTPLEAFVAKSGVNICGRHSFAEINPQHIQGAGSMAQDFKNFDHDDVIDAARSCAESAKADAVYLAGVPCPLLAHRSALETEISKPVITYLSSYARLFASLGIATKETFTCR